MPRAFGATSKTPTSMPSMLASPTRSTDSFTKGTSSLVPPTTDTCRRGLSGTSVTPSRLAMAGEMIVDCAPVSTISVTGWTPLSVACTSVMFCTMRIGTRVGASRITRGDSVAGLVVPRATVHPPRSAATTSEATMRGREVIEARAGQRRESRRTRSGWSERGR